MKRRDLAVGYGGRGIGSVVGFVLTTTGAMILLALLAADHGHSEAAKTFDPDTIGVGRYCSTVRLFYGAPDAMNLVRIQDPSEDACKAALGRYRARLQHLTWTKQAIRRDLRTTGNTPFEKALRKQLMRLNQEELFIMGRICRDLFTSARGLYVCGRSTNRSYGGLAGRIVRFGDGPTLGNDFDGSETCTAWPPRRPIGTPPFDALFAPPVALPTSWPDAEAELSAYGFACDPREARCSFESGFISFRDDELMGISGTTVVLHLVAEGKSVSRQDLPSASTDVQLCMGGFSVAL